MSIEKNPENRQTKKQPTNQPIKQTKHPEINHDLTITQQKMGGDTQLEGNGQKALTLRRCILRRTYSDLRNTSKMVEGYFSKQLKAEIF